MKNIFENAKWGDRIKCRNGRTATFLGIDNDHALLMLAGLDTEEYICVYNLDGTADDNEEYDIIKQSNYENTI